MLSPLKLKTEHQALLLIAIPSLFWCLYFLSSTAFYLVSLRRLPMYFFPRKHATLNSLSCSKRKRQLRYLEKRLLLGIEKFTTLCCNLLSEISVNIYIPLSSLLNMLEYSKPFRFLIYFSHCIFSMYSVASVTQLNRLLVIFI